jgi:hypothetical protein
MNTYMSFLTRRTVNVPSAFSMCIKTNDQGLNLKIFDHDHGQHLSRHTIKSGVTFHLKQCSTL